MNTVNCEIRYVIQGVTGGTDQTLGECSLGQTIPIKPKTTISKVERLRRNWTEKRVDLFGVCVLYSVRNVTLHSTSIAFLRYR